MEHRQRPVYSFGIGIKIRDEKQSVNTSIMIGTESTGRAMRLCLVVPALLFLSACGGSTALIKNCCYEGDAALVYVNRVQFVAPDGTTSAFNDIYPGYTPQDSFLTKSFPFPKVQYSLVTYDSLAVIFPLYDANKNGILEEPETTVLYLREGAIGMGHKVDHLAVDGKRVNAITTSRSDVGGLMRYLDARKDSLTPEVQAEFRDLVRVGLDYIQRGSEGADRQTQKITP